MTAFEILTLVALWCSTPTQYRLNSEGVNSCRDQLSGCLTGCSNITFAKPDTRRDCSVKCAKAARLP